MKISVYINEESLQGQLCDDISTSIYNLLAIINALESNYSVEVSYLTSRAIFTKQVCARTGLIIAMLNGMDHDLFQMFKVMLDKCKFWDKNKPLQLPNSIYLYQMNSVNGTSIAEARESVDVGSETLLVSFSESQYIGNTLSVEKDGIVKDVSHMLSTTDVFDFLARKGITLKYDRSTYLRVDDKQTILADYTQFKVTGYKVQGRTVYERIGKDEYWYVDNLHRDGSAHIEVFRKSDGLFIGTCDIEDMSKFKAASKKEQAKKAPLRF